MYQVVWVKDKLQVAVAVACPCMGAIKHMLKKHKMSSMHDS